MGLAGCSLCRSELGSAPFVRIPCLPHRLVFRARSISEPPIHGSTGYAHGSADFPGRGDRALPRSGRELWPRTWARERSRRRNRLARLFGSGALQEIWLYRHGSLERLGVVLLALPAFDLGRLQQWHANLVRPDVFHGHGGLTVFCLCLAAP